MDDLTIFGDDYNKSTIRSTKDRRFSVYDVLVTFGVVDKSANACNIYKRLIDKHPELAATVLRHQFPGRGQRPTPVADEATIRRILEMCKAAPWQAEITSDKFYPRAEVQTIKVIAEAFSDQNPIRQFYCAGYRIDLYLAEARIAVECDENGHTAYDSRKEHQRQKAIKSALACSFVRFDPYQADFNIGSVIRQIRDLI
jgi:very-short-patch-repair endonuclease